MQKCPVRLHILTGNVLVHSDVADGRPFIVDLSTTAFGENAKIDYDHKSGKIENILGECFNFSVDEEGLFSDGFIQYRDELDPVSLLVDKMHNKIKYGVSPRLQLGDYVDLPPGEMAVVNFSERSGPLRIYKNSLVKGAAVSPYPTDEGTSITLLSASDIVLLASTNTILQEKETMSEDNPTPDVAPDSPKIKEPLLKELADLIGADKALELYQGGEDLQTLLDAAANAVKLGFTAPGKAGELDSASLSDDPPKEDVKTEEDPAKKTASLSASLTPLLNKIASLEKNVVNLSAKLTANLSEKSGVSQTVDPQKSQPTGYDRNTEIERRNRLLQN